MSESIDQGWAVKSDEYFRARVDSISKDLRDLADKVTRQASLWLDDPGQGSGTQYTQAAASITSTILQEVLHLGLDRLIQEAGEAAVAREKVMEA